MCVCVWPQKCSYLFLCVRQKRACALLFVLFFCFLGEQNGPTDVKRGVEMSERRGQREKIYIVHGESAFQRVHIAAL